MKIIPKNISLIRAVDGFVAHQCNCVHQGKAAGVAALIFRTFRYSDIYKKRSGDDTPGTAIIKHPYPAMQGYPTVINLMAQKFPGQPIISDGPEERRQWLMESIASALKQLGPGAHKIFIPYLMGCRLAGGSWDIVSGVLGFFEKYAEVEFTCCVW
jgi:hypothetical protein